MVADTYTEKAVEEAISAFGDDPGAVKAGIAQQEMAKAPMQEAIQGQASNVSAMQQLAEHDKLLAGQVNQANQAQMEANQVDRARLSAYGALGATPQETIAKAQAPLPETVYRAPTQGFLSPFVADSLLSGQSNAYADQFDLASQTRGSLERAIGTKAQAYADAVEAMNLRKQQELENAIALAKLTGATSFTDPNTGEVYQIEKEVSEADRLKQIVADIQNPAISLDEIIRNNPDISPLEIANMNERVWGALKESDEEIRSKFGFNPNSLTSREGMSTSLTPESVGYANQLRDEFNQQSGDFRTVRDAYNKISTVSDTGVGDISLITAYMKMIDPSSSVRETEFANAEEASGYLRKVYNIDAKITKGNRLDPQTRKDFINEASNIYNTYQSQNEQLVSEYSRLSNQIGVDPSLVITDTGQSQDLSRVRVRDKATGQTGTIPAWEFDEALYERI